MTKIMRDGAGLMLAVAVTLGTTGAAGAETAQDFYAGKQISLMIGTTAGGGYDAYARLLARHIGRHIPGNPAIIPKNVPGAWASDRISK